jgi:hypothetical protein
MRQDAILEIKALLHIFIAQTQFHSLVFEGARFQRIYLVAAFPHIPMRANRDGEKILACL